MKKLSVGELKSGFSEVLEQVRNNETFVIQYGKKKKPVAMIVPYKPDIENKCRTIGIMDGRANITFRDDFKLTEEEFTDLS